MGDLDGLFTSTTELSADSSTQVRQLQVEHKHEFERIVEVAGEEHRGRIKKMTRMPQSRKRKALFNSDYFYVEQTENYEIHLKFFPDGIHNQSAVIGSVGEDIDLAVVMLISSVAYTDPHLLRTLELALFNGKYGESTFDIRSMTSEPPSMRWGAAESLYPDSRSVHEIEVVHSADDFDQDIDLETQMYQLSQKSESGDTVATVNNYVHKEATDEIVVLIELPDQSHGRLAYDVPESTDDPFAEFLSCAVHPDRDHGEDISLANMELITGASIPVSGGNGAWEVDVEKSLVFDDIDDYMSNIEERDSEEQWTVVGGRMILFMTMVLSLILAYAIF